MPKYGPFNFMMCVCTTHVSHDTCNAKVCVALRIGARMVVQIITRGGGEAACGNGYRVASFPEASLVCSTLVLMIFWINVGDNSTRY